MHPEFVKMEELETDGIFSFQAHIFWLNAYASKNMNRMSVTKLMFQPEMFWLNDDAP